MPKVVDERFKPFLAGIGVPHRFDIFGVDQAQEAVADDDPLLLDLIDEIGVDDGVGRVPAFAVRLDSLEGSGHYYGAILGEDEGHAEGLAAVNSTIVMVVGVHSKKEGRCGCTEHSTISAATPWVSLWLPCGWSDVSNFISRICC